MPNGRMATTSKSESTINTAVELNDSEIAGNCNSINVNGSCNVAASITAGNSSNDPIVMEGLQCFVCDVKVQGRHYSLATCRTQSSRSRVIEKLGELVGERYMVVISEDDVICRSCANLMNTLDRLEFEMRDVRDVILRFLERKYSLDDGELLGNCDVAKLSQPPQITKGHTQNGGGYHARKKAAILSSATSSNESKHKKSNVWMQCDKCRYTTQYNAFMVHHIRQHIKQKVYCDKCGIQFPGRLQQVSHRCIHKERSNESDTEEPKEIEKEPPTEATNLEAMDVSLEGKEEITPLIAISSDSQSQSRAKEESIQLIRLSHPSDLQIQSILTTDETDSTEQPVYVHVLQPVDVGVEEAQSSAMTGTCSDTGMMIKVNESSGKQILTLAEDGSLEMVEVPCWDDAHHSNSGIPF